MKRTLMLDGLDCANCANKMEAAIRKLEGVKSASINFMTQKLIIEADDLVLESIIKMAGKEIRKIDSGCRIVI